MARWIDADRNPVIRLRYLMRTPICDFCYDFPDLCNAETLLECGLVEDPPREAIDEDEIDP